MFKELFEAEKDKETIFAKLKSEEPSEEEKEAKKQALLDKEDKEKASSDEEKNAETDELEADADEKETTAKKIKNENFSSYFINKKKE